MQARQGSHDRPAPAPFPRPDRRERPGRGLAFAALGGLCGALAASSCCLLPLVLVSLGVGGAWFARLTALAPYQPIFLAFTLSALGFGFWRLYGRGGSCAAEAACARPLSQRFVKSGLWLATLLIAAAIAFPFLADILLPT